MAATPLPSRGLTLALRSLIEDPVKDLVNDLVCDLVDDFVNVLVNDRVNDFGLQVVDHRSCQ